MNRKISELVYYDVEDIVAIMGVSRNKAYGIISKLNSELAQKGYIVVSGKIHKDYFNSRLLPANKGGRE